MADNLTDAHTFTLDWQGNIYTIATITQHMSHTTKLIVATLNRKVFCLELSMSHCARPCGCVVVPQTQELQFTYIPSGAEIISIDAFNKSKVGDDFVIGVTIIKSAESGSPGQYLNIYSDWDSVADIDGGVGGSGGGSYYLDEMSDDEMEGDEGGRGPQRSRSFNAITPAQLAQALAAAAGGGQGGVQPFQGVTGMGPQLGSVPGPGAANLGPGSSASQSSASTPGAGRITTDMFQQAIQQALMGMGGGGQGQQAQAQEVGGQGGDDGELTSKVERMKEMGIVDEGLALQALQIMGGDLQAAVDLIFSGWEGGEDSMQ